MCLFNKKKINLHELNKFYLNKKLKNQKLDLAGKICNQRWYGPFRVEGLEEKQERYVYFSLDKHGENKFYAAVGIWFDYAEKPEDQISNNLIGLIIRTQIPGYSSSAKDGYLYDNVVIPIKIKG